MWTAIATIAALVAVGIAARQLWLFRVSLGVDVILRLEKQFDENDMCEKRRRAARALQSGTSVEDVEPVLDFFETVGLLLRRRVVDKEVVWNSFAYWVLRYAELARVIRGT